MFLGQRGLLHQVRGQLALHLIDGLGQGIDLHLEPAGGLVDEIDGLVGQLPAGDVTRGEFRRGHQRGVANANAMVDLVALFEAAQDRNGVVQRRLAHHHGLEAPFECLVLLDVLAVLVERGGADAAQIPARQGRLEHVGGVHRALGPARADQRVQLVDEQNDLAVGAGDLLQHRLQAVLELAAVLGARDERAQIERLDALVLERFGYVARGYPLRDALDDGGLAHAGLADEHRVVLGAPGKHLHGPANFLVAADDRIELALAGQIGEIARILDQGLVALLGVGIGHALVAAHVGQGLEQVVATHARLAQDAGRVAHILGQHAEQEVLAGDVLVLELHRLAGGLFEQVLEPAPDESVGAAAAYLRLFVQGLVDFAPDGLGVGAQLAQHRQNDAIFLSKQGAQQVLGRHLLVRALVGQVMGRSQCFLSLDGELVEPHGFWATR